VLASSPESDRLSPVTPVLRHARRPPAAARATLSSIAGLLPSMSISIAVYISITL
jgi:hypothetical protein